MDSGLQVAGRGAHRQLSGIYLPGCKNFPKRLKRNFARGHQWGTSYIFMEFPYRKSNVSKPMEQELRLGEFRRVAVVVAHPDDETLWAGGLLLGYPQWSIVIVTLCRGSDPDRAPKFHKALRYFNAEGLMGDLDDGPEQVPLPAPMVEQTIISLLPRRDYDLVVTHGPNGEYTRHRRHEEVSRAVHALWRRGRLSAGRMFQFSYEDGGRSYLPRPCRDACFHLTLSEDLWARKHGIISHIYGFDSASWEARAVTRMEAFDDCHKVAPAEF